MFNSVTDLSALAEQLCRIEHKLDLIVEYLAKKDGDFELRRIDSAKHIDPITQEPVNYLMDFFKRHVVRRASDGTKLLPPLIFNQNTTTGTSNGGETGSGNE